VRYATYTMNTRTQLRVLVACHFAPPHSGGIEQVVLSQVKSLHTYGDEVNVVSSAYSDVPPGEDTLLEGVRIVRVPTVNVFEHRYNIPFPLFGIRGMYMIWRAVARAEVVHLHDVFYQMSWWTGLCAFLLRKPVYLTQHVAYVPHPNALVLFLQRVVYASAGSLLFRLARKIVVYNTHVQDFLYKRGIPEHKVVLQKNGVDVKLFRPARDKQEIAHIRTKYNLPSDRVLVLFVGRFVAKKGYALTYHAQDPAYDLVFVGTGAFPKEWVEAKGVHVLGERTQEEVAELYRACDICACPVEGEVLTLTMQEALASGIPLVTSEHEGYTVYDIDRTQIRLIPRTVSAIHASLVELAQHADLRESAGLYSRAFAERVCDASVHAGEFPVLYDSVRRAREVCVTTSWDDGHVLDMRLAELLTRYGITGTFYVSPFDVEFSKEERLTTAQVRALSHDFEIGAHTLTHRHLPTLSDEESREEIVQSKAVLEKVLHEPVTSFCYPAGKYEARHVPMVRDAGFTLARTVTRFSFGVKDPFRLHTSVHTYDHWLDIWGLLLLVRGNPFHFLKLYRRWDRQACYMFDYVRTHGGVFHLWGHSWEVAQHGDWERLEAVLQYIHAHEGVRYVQNRDLV
jgi:D-inositol-3-phosphate glycosyltransferase